MMDAPRADGSSGGTRASQFFIAHRRRLALCAGLPLFWMILLVIFDAIQGLLAWIPVFLLYPNMVVLLTLTAIDDAFRWLDPTILAALAAMLHVAVWTPIGYLIDRLPALLGDDCGYREKSYTIAKTMGFIVLVWIGIPFIIWVLTGEIHRAGALSQP